MFIENFSGYLKDLNATPIGVVGGLKRRQAVAKTQPTTKPAAWRWAGKPTLQARLKSSIIHLLFKTRVTHCDCRTRFNCLCGFGVE